MRSIRKKTERLQRVNENLAQKYRTLRAAHTAMVSQNHLASELLAVEDSAFLCAGHPHANARARLRHKLLVLTRERKLRVALERALKALEGKLTMRARKLAMAQSRSAADSCPNPYTTTEKD